jgi:hypothetical protein
LEKAADFSTGAGTDAFTPSRVTEAEAVRYKELALLAETT